jgi:hypothetical protein
MTTTPQNRPTSSGLRVNVVEGEGNGGNAKRSAAEFEVAAAMEGYAVEGALFPPAFCTALIWLAGRGALA